MDSSDLLGRLRKALNQEVESVPPGWKTANQLCVEWDLQTAQVLKLLRAGIKKGIIETQKFRIECPSRMSYPIPHYREISKQ